MHALLYLASQAFPFGKVPQDLAAYEGEDASEGFGIRRPRFELVQKERRHAGAQAPGPTVGLPIRTEGFFADFRAVSAEGLKEESERVRIEVRHDEHRTPKAASAALLQAFQTLDDIGKP
jgi:hypothetical protein